MAVKMKSNYWQMVLRLFANTSACGMVGFMKRTNNHSDNLSAVADQTKEKSNEKEDANALLDKRRFFFRVEKIRPHITVALLLS